MSTQGVRRSMEKQGKYAKIQNTDGRTHSVSDNVTLELLIAAKNIWYETFCQNLSQLRKQIEL